MSCRKKAKWVMQWCLPGPHLREQQDPRSHPSHIWNWIKTSKQTKKRIQHVLAMWACLSLMTLTKKPSYSIYSSELFVRLMDIFRSWAHLTICHSWSLIFLPDPKKQRDFVLFFFEVMTFWKNWMKLDCIIHTHFVSELHVCVQNE